jgi:hypothetical protein
MLESPSSGGRLRLRLRLSREAGRTVEGKVERRGKREVDVPIKG